MIKIWKGKSSDLLLVLLYFALYASGIHILVTIKYSIKHHENIVESIKDPFNFLLTICLAFFFMSPVWVYFRKVPKILKIDSSTKKLEIQKKRKTLKYNMDKIRFYKRPTRLFYILEIHATFESPRNGEFEKISYFDYSSELGLILEQKKNGRNCS